MRSLTLQLQQDNEKNICIFQYFKTLKSDIFQDFIDVMQNDLFVRVEAREKRLNPFFSL